jgi:hypothetical protein
MSIAPEFHGSNYKIVRVFLIILNEDRSLKFVVIVIDQRPAHSF